MSTLPILIGLTGSIGMGKSTTAGIFAQYDMPVWDADDSVERLYSGGGHGVKPIGDLVPESILGGLVDRSVLKSAIKSDPALLSRIEGIVHPLVAADRAEFVRRNLMAEMLLFDIPLLFEGGLDTEMNYIVVVTTTAETQRSRVLARGTMKQDAFEMIVKRQMPDAEKRAKADFVIDTATIESARAGVHAVVSEVRKAHA